MNERMNDPLIDYTVARRNLFAVCDCVCVLVWASENATQSTGGPSSATESAKFTLISTRLDEHFTNETYVTADSYNR